MARLPLPTYEPGTFLYVPGLFGSDAWRLLGNRVAQDIIRASVAPIWEAMGERPGSGGITAHLCTGRRRASVRSPWQAEGIYQTFTRDSWNAGELDTEQLASLVLEDTETDSDERAGFFPDDWYYWLYGERVEGTTGTARVTIMRNSNELLEGEPVPEYREPSPSEAGEAALLLEQGREGEYEADREQDWRTHWVYRVANVPTNTNVSSLEALPWGEWLEVTSTFDLDVSGAGAYFIQAEQREQDSDRINMVISGDHCAELKLLAATLARPDALKPNDPINLDSRNKPVVSPVGNWNFKGYFGSSNSYQYSGNGPDGVIDWDKIATLPMYPYYVANANTCEQWEHAGDATGLINAGLPISLEIHFPNDGAEPVAGRYDPNNPIYREWLFDGFTLSSDVWIQLGAGTVSWYAHTLGGAEGNQGAENYAPDIRPEIRGFLGNPAAEHFPDDTESKWYTLHGGTASIDYLSERGQFTKTFLRYVLPPADAEPGIPAEGIPIKLRARVPHGAGSVPTVVFVHLLVASRFRLINEYGECDIFTTSAPTEVIIRVPLEEPLNGDLVTDRVPDPDGFLRGYNQTIFPVKPLELPGGGTPPDYPIEGHFYPERFYGREYGQYDFNPVLWENGNLIYDEAPNTKPVDAPEAEGESEPEYYPQADIIGFTDPYNRTHQQLAKLNPVFKYLLDTDNAITRRFSRIFWASQQRGRSPKDDGAKKFADLFTRGTTLAAGYFLKILDEDLLFQTGDPKNTNHITSFALYLTTDVFEPVPASILKGENGESPLYGWQLVCGWKDDEGNVTDGSSLEAEKEIEDFNAALYASALIPLARAISSEFNLDDMASDYIDKFQAYFDKYGEKAVFMTTVRGSGVIAGFWRV